MKIRVETIDTPTIIELDGILECWIKDEGLYTLGVGTKKTRTERRYSIIIQRENSPQELTFNSKDKAHEVFDQIWEEVRPKERKDLRETPERTSDTMFKKQHNYGCPNCDFFCKTNKHVQVFECPFCKDGLEKDGVCF